MSKRAKQKLPSKTLIAIIAAIVGVCIVAGVALHYRSNQSGTTKPNTNIDYSPANSADNKTSEDQKDQSLPTPTPTGKPDVTPAPTSSAITAQITGANIQAGNVHVGTLVSGTTAGNCVLTAAKDGQSTVQLGSSNVRLNVNEYDCGVYNVPTSSFASSGMWRLTLTLTSGSDKVSGTYDVAIP